MNDKAAGTVLAIPRFRLWEAVCHEESDPPFTVLYEDESVLVCKKAPGVAVQSASARVKDLESMLKKDHGGGTSGIPYLAVVHRLDQPVQGLLVFAKTPNAAAALSGQVQQGGLTKEYLCICRQEETAPDLPQKGALTDYLWKDGRTNLSRIVTEETPGAKRAELEYEILETRGEWLLLKIILRTGRHHQIRVQLFGRGVPIAGDQKYGTVLAPDRQLKLCAYRLGFSHPRTGQRMVFDLSVEKKETSDEQDRI